MQTSGIDSAVGSAQRASADRGVASMQSEDFFKLLITELKSQDPFQPAKTSDMIQQISQIRGIELSKNLTDALTGITTQQHALGASELLGKYVQAARTAEDGTKSEIGGIVTGVRFGSDGAVLELDTGHTVKAADVTHITSAENAKAGGATSGTGTTSGNGATDEGASDASGNGQAGTGTADGAADKAPAKPRMLSGLFPWLKLDGEFHL